MVAATCVRVAYAAPLPSRVICLLGARVLSQDEHVQRGNGVLAAPLRGRRVCDAGGRVTLGARG
eukprot:4928448-Lingulodinium_polyedra.AAC.1